MERARPGKRKREKLPSRIISNESLTTTNEKGKKTKVVRMKN